MRLYTKKGLLHSEQALFQSNQISNAYCTTKRLVVTVSPVFTLKR
ncbi:hypothetical protein SAMN04515668_3244 [Hymenobacter arizonensis]|uniref:Uncharacterized protein n=1 Tax=Hymenobacter arizonensis TaxID=1227077 RepID=A0A1I5ZVI9_HYMAR|nr:hypothetical protein SAMN04515668_3244 [Hymenobacter arizonensis]